jgi:hypothetical protein
VLSFGYWTTNFAEVQRALAARNLSAARRTPLIAAVTVQGLRAKTGDLQFNNAIPILISKYLPSGMLGVAITGLLAAFMAGVAANVTAFNTVVSYDLWGAYVRKDEPDCSPPSSSPCSGGGPPPGPGSGGWPPAPWPRSPSTSCTPAVPLTSARRCRPTSGGGGRLRGHRLHPDRPAVPDLPLLGGAAMPSLFDLRMVIGGLPVLYGVVLAILAGGAVFLAWALLRPLRAEDLEKPEEEES